MFGLEFLSLFVFVTVLFLCFFVTGVLFVFVTGVGFGAILLLFTGCLINVLLYIIGVEKD